MKPLNPSVILRWHAHVCFDVARRDAARALPELINVELASRFEMGRFHEKRVGIRTPTTRCVTTATARSGEASPTN